MQTKFQAALQKLNPAQRRAVETIEGPLLISAGPGTGKTQTLALRLANILLETQAQPQNLLALTFTESAAFELKTRLAKIIGPTAFGINAFTFHAFAARLTNIFASEFENDKTPLDELAQLKILREILDQSKFELLRPLRAPDFYLRELPRALATLKQENITPNTLRKILEQEKNTLQQQPRLNPRTQKPFAKILTAENRLAKLWELATLFEKYEKICLERGLADFEELIYTVNQKLRDEKNQFLLAYLQENFWYLTVDEFQDTSGSQLAFLRAWGSFAENPNLCAVGDDDQSIFRFAGASLANILEFHQSFSSAQIIPLTQNYRSTKAICSLAQKLITQNTERLVNKIPGLQKELTAVNTTVNLKPQVWHFPDPASEVTTVGKAIKKLLAQNTPPNEIAVIYRNRTHGDTLANFLAQQGLPVWRADGENALKNFRVKQVWQILRLLENPRDGVAALTTFFADFVQAPAEQVWQFLSAKTPDFLLSALANPNPNIQKFGQKLIAWQHSRSEKSLPELIENIIAESNLTRVIANQKEIESAQALLALLDFTRNFWRLNNTASLAELLENLKTMQNQNLALPLNTQNPQAVTLTTAHRAKGREFENVFIIAAADEFWGGRLKREKLRLPKNFLPAPHLTEEPDHLQEERRLFFVAATRAKKNLIFSVAENYNNRLVTPSRFLAEIGPELLIAKKISPNPISNLPTSPKPEFNPQTQNLFQTLLQNFRLSPTALNNFRLCPRRFFLVHLLHLPVAQTTNERASQIFGLAIHSALESFFREFKRTGQLPQIAFAHAHLAQALQKEPLKKRDRERLRHDAEIALTKYLENQKAKLRPPAEVELNFGNHAVYLDTIPLTGKIDRIDFASQQNAEFVFVDYKAMPPLSRAAIKGETANSDGNSYRQLLFYYLLAERDQRFFGRPTSCVLSFIRPNNRQEFREETFQPTATEISELKKEIRATWQKIQKLEFPKTENQPDCQRCQFREVCER